MLQEGNTTFHGQGQGWGEVKNKNPKFPFLMDILGSLEEWEQSEYVLKRDNKARKEKLTHSKNTSESFYLIF